MSLRVVAIACLTALSIAAPLARPANFEADSMLAVRARDARSYAPTERSTFEADPMLSVDAGASSSYANTEARSNFEADPLLQVDGDEAQSSYAT